MKLPFIEYAAVVPGPVAAAAAPYQAGIQLTDVVQKGLAAYGQELVKTQAQEATIQLTEALDKTEQAIKSRKEMSQDEVVAAFGDQVPEQVRGFLGRSDAAGKPLPVPMWAVGDSLYEKASRQAIEAASQNITTGGWAADWQGKAIQHVQDRQRSMAEYHLRALDSYLQHTQVQNVERLRNSGAFDQADQAVMDALPFEERQKQKALTETARQLRPAQDAMMSTSPEDIRSQISRLQSDPRAMEAIPESQRKHLVAELELREKKYTALGVAEKAFQAGNNGTPFLDAEAANRALAEASRGAAPDAVMEARRMVDARLKDDRDMRIAEDSPRMGRLSVLISQGRGLARSSDDYVNLSPEGKAKVEDLWKAEARLRRAERSADQAAQREHDRTIEARFRALPVSEAKDIDLDKDSRFQGVSEQTYWDLQKVKRGAAEAYAKDHGVAEDKLTAMLTQTAASQDYGKKDTALFIGHIKERLASEFPDKLKPPTESDVRRIVADEILYGDPGFFSRNTPRWKNELKPDKDWTLIPDERQPDKVSDRRTEMGASSAPSTATPAPEYLLKPPEVGDVVDGPRVGKPAGTQYRLNSGGTMTRVK